MLFRAFQFSFRSAVVCGFAIAASLVGSSAGSTALAQESSAVTCRGLISLIDDVQVPAHRAGVVTGLPVREGDEIARGALIAQIDDAQSKLEADAARAEREAADSKAKSDVDVRFAVATHLVAVAEHRKGVEANQNVAEALSQSEIDRLKLAADQAELRIEASKHEVGQRGLDAKAFVARAELAELDVLRRKTTAPFAGIVAERLVREGEWIEPGEPVVRLVKLDRLRVETFVKVADLLPGELVGRSMTIRVALARGRTEQFEGRVVFVSPLVQPGGDYCVWAEVDNRKDGNQWLLRPGLPAEVVFAP